MAALIPGPIRRAFEALLSPVVRGLIAFGVGPSTITTVGTLAVVGSGLAFATHAPQVGGLLLLVSGILDMLDGGVARGSGGSTKFGAFYDSTLDRIGDGALFGGILLSFISGGVPEQWVMLAATTVLVALSAALVVSYARARAEGLGFECSVGVAQRAERILGLGVPTLFFGAGPDGFLLLGVVAILALTSVVTVIQRIVHVYRLTRVKHRTTEARWVPPVFAGKSSERTEL